MAGELSRAHIRRHQRFTAEDVSMRSKAYGNVSTVGRGCKRAHLPVSRKELA